MIRLLLTLVGKAIVVVAVVVLFSSYIATFKPEYLAWLIGYDYVSKMDLLKQRLLAEQQQAQGRGSG